ncbi:10245_t:CDS:1, partial [Acaulospora colombiana]
HTLDGHNPTDIVKSITHLLEPLDSRRIPMFAILYPIALSQEQREMFHKAHEFTHDHCTTFLKESRFSDKQSIDVAGCLFLDLTPMQVAAKWVRGRLVNGRWQLGKNDTTTLTVLGSVDELSLEEVIEKLILPTVSSLAAVRGVAILKPENAFPNVKTWDLNHYFLDIPVKWLSTADISYGAACILENDFPYSICDFSPGEGELVEDALDIQLADGQLITLLPMSSPLPATELFYFTTSKDNQTTATLLFSKKGTSCGVAILELTPKVRGAARIKVVIQCDSFERTKVTTQELGSSDKVILVLDDVVLKDARIRGLLPTISAESKFPVPGVDGVIGELPE